MQTQGGLNYVIVKTPGDGNDGTFEINGYDDDDDDDHENEYDGEKSKEMEVQRKKLIKIWKRDREYVTALRFVLRSKSEDDPLYGTEKALMREYKLEMKQIENKIRYLGS
jgi:hypothetical protein